MNQAVKLAIEKGGYVNACYMEGCNHWREMVMTDLLFWQALGKALGVEGDRTSLYPTTAKQETKLVPVWQFYAIKFFELRMTGGDEEAYWKELLK